MLVDINLLPQKEVQGFKSTLIIIAAAALLLSAATWLGVDYMISTEKLKEKENQLQQETKLVEMQQQKTQTASQAVTTAPLQEKVDYIRSKDIAAAGFLQHLVALLPERGYFMKYEYTDGNTVVINARFDTLAESAQYMHELENSPYIKSAAAEKMETSNFEEIEAGEDMSAFEEFLPRYQMLYKIEFDRETIKELMGEE
ncbi:PilN domain-containing protein [Fictibacillus aquaticus]|uniref:Uncharacterized protein n=1 Tax=Fictibacillus aquaticus TaxID=2021314 RepID=A0A235FEC4_9BACL|nr:PilN domain-containing protein [Fictibacillus aquaticus]OYD59726.1 hypothetical protein CGZ90_07550 [Fictibacillus aquaticus]